MGENKSRISKWLAKSWWNGISAIAAIIAILVAIIAIITTSHKPEDQTAIAKANERTEIMKKGAIKSIIKNIKGEGFGEDMFNRDEARKLAKEMAMKDLIGKFSNKEENAVRRYAETLIDTVEQTKLGTWKAHVVLNIKESDIIKQ